MVLDGVEPEEGLEEVELAKEEPVVGWPVAHMNATGSTGTHMCNHCSDDTTPIIVQSTVFQPWQH